MRACPIIILTVCFLSLTSCFTGIESTPRITDKEVRRNVPDVNVEAETAALLAPDPMSRWQPGRRFLVSDPKISLLFEKEPAISVGEILVFESLTGDASITGDSISVLTFRRADSATSGEPLRYKLGIAPSALADAATLPMSVDLAMVDNARDLLAGKRFYITSSMRVDKSLTPTGRGRKYVPVTITDVNAGNADYPLRLDITDDLGQSSSIAMTVGTARSSTRNFDKIFVIDDPRLRYPAITEATWQNIANSRVVAGMTPQECRLALGTPNDIRKWHNGGSFFESWACDNGQYLIFIDGLLAEIH